MRASTLALLLVLASSLGCSGTAVGTGTTSDGGSSGSNASDDPSVGSGGAGGKSDGGTGAPNTSAWDALFGTPSTTTMTPNTVTGLWAGLMSNTSDDVRLKIGASSITIAVRCKSGLGDGFSTIGVEVSAIVNASSMRVLESKTASTTTSSCQINVRPQSLPRCGTSASASSGCFDVVDGTLEFRFVQGLFTGDGAISYGPQSSFSKVSD